MNNRYYVYAKLPIIFYLCNRALSLLKANNLEHSRKAGFSSKVHVINGRHLLTLAVLGTNHFNFHGDFLTNF